MAQRCGSVPLESDWQSPGNDCNFLQRQRSRARGGARLHICALDARLCIAEAGLWGQRWGQAAHLCTDCTSVHWLYVCAPGVNCKKISAVLLESHSAKHLDFKCNDLSIKY